MTRENIDAQRNLGVKGLDRDHDALSGHLGNLGNALQVGDYDAKVVEMAFVELLGHIKEHFKREETWMLRVNYPGLRFHKKQHQRLTEVIGEFLDAFASNPTRDKGEDVYGLVEDWLVDHTLNADQVLCGFLGYRRQITRH